MNKQLEFDFGVTEEQACIMCHLSSECEGCCARCKGECAQKCSLPFIATEKSRWDTWMHLVANNLPELKKFIPTEWRKELKKHQKYGKR